MFSIVLSPLEGWDPISFSTEEQLLEALQFYKMDVCGKLFRQTWHFDAARWCNPVGALLLKGNFECFDVWLEKNLAGYKESDLPTTRDYASESYEVGEGLLYGACYLLIMLGQYTDSAALLNSVGFTWSTEGFENHDKWNEAFNTAFPVSMLEPETVLCRLLIFLSSSKDDIDEAAVDSWIPPPTRLAELERGYVFMRTCFLSDLTSLGCRAFLRLGREDDAYELAQLIVAPEQQTLKKPTLITCHSILGQIAAKRGEMDEADGHFARALEEAKLSRLPMLEVIAARDWKKHVLEPAGRENTGAESVIDAACVEMGKSREQMARVLLA